MTDHKLLITALVLCAMLLLVPGAAAAQQPEPAPAEPAATAPAADDQPGEDKPGSREVEISEDNFRRFMELDDQPIERAMPIMQAPPQAGLENMQRLPESSQKHLREQLREIILGSGAWTPASMSKDYPFVPSEAAQSDGALRQLEATAWQELVAQYHAREAEIQAARQGGSAAAEAAAMAGQNTATGGQNAANGGQSDGQNAAGQAGGQQGQDGDQGQQAGGRQGQGSAAQQASEQARRQQQNQSQNSASRAGQSQYRPPPEGSEQSALEFLTGQAPGSNGRPALSTGTGSGQATGRLSLEQLERVQGIGRVSGDPAVAEPQPDADDSADDDDEQARDRPTDDG